MSKPIPAPRFKEIRPPNENYTYFENKEQYPFRPQATEFELVNAAWLADFALLAYGSEDFIRKHFKSSGLTDAGFDFKFFDKRTTQCFVAQNQSFVVVSVRGTEIDNFHGALIDWMRNFEALPVPDESGGKVHEGFQKDLAEVWVDLKDHLQTLLAGGTRTLWITGHSLGAATAILAAERAVRDGKFSVAGVYPFAAPRVGDESFRQLYLARGLNERTYRFVYDVDVVPKLPPKGFYVHVGHREFIDAAGHLHFDTVQTEGDPEPDVLKHMSSKWLALLENVFGRKIPAPFADHAPIYYAAHVWNNLTS